MTRMAWPGHAELKQRAESAEFQLKAKTAELEIADGEIERLKARVRELEAENERCRCALEKAIEALR